MRCIKPNSIKSAAKFEDELVVHQVPFCWNFVCIKSNFRWCNLIVLFELENSSEANRNILCSL